ncbi:MAG: EAL domain-containing protein [Lachnospiraceae bacterium]|nr:EAL domain-containing protein [Ruminococcus sp.]MCM1275421.1 EAL domain-containing protein [Lachnospiraceae bacterium]
MPIQMQCCGLAIMVIVIFFYKSQKTIRLNTGTAFLNAFWMTFVCIMFDIFSCIAITRRDVFPEIVVEIISKTYLATLVGVTFFALMYICTDIYTVKTVYRRMMLRYGAFVAAAVILIYAAPIYFYLDEATGELYSTGASAYSTYLFALTTIIIVTVRLIKDRAKISRNRRFAVATWLGVWTLAAVVQFFFPKLLLVGFASAVGMLVLYLRLENPGFNIDRQTGLFNHEAFVQYTGELYGMNESFSLLCLIIEPGSFSALRSDVESAIIAEAVKYLSAMTDMIVFRNSTNEIMLLYPNREVAERSIKVLRKRFEKGWGKNGGILVSPTWVYAPNSGIADNTEELLYLMRYVGHDNGETPENRFHEVTVELAMQLRREKDTEQLIIDALKDDRVEVWFQPIFSTEDHCFTSAEALVRIRREDGGLVPPGVFVENAERNGMILQLGETVFRKACRFISESNIKQYGIKYIEINLSVVQCAYNELAKDYIRIMEESGVSPELINLEITESASMNARKTLLDNMKRLMDYGVSFSLDDFGTGQSNLNYIIDMPVEIVKFDKGMTNAYFENGKAKYIMDAAMNMIRGLGLRIVSEGVETAEQFYTMENLGINYIQGYYFSKPLPADEFLEFIIKSNKEAY